jgi:nicotinate-nucleotide adenylyltransferase
VARAAQAALGLDVVLFAPVGAQPLKPRGSAAGFEDRLAMTRLAIDADPGFAVSLADAPKPSGEANYTLETLLGLRAELSAEGALFCLMGADSFAGLRRWHRGAEIPFVAPLVVASRPGESLDDLKAFLPDGLAIETMPRPDEMGQEVVVRSYLLRNQAGDSAPFYLLPGLEIEISAREIRDQLRIREQIRVHRQAPEGQQPECTLLPGPVSEYIRAHGLYRRLAAD